MKTKKIFLLIGQKGSGKSFIGTIFERKFRIKFIRVEDWAKLIKKDRYVDDETYHKQVFEVIESGIRDCIKNIDSLVFESTGLTDYFDQMIESLKKDFHLKTIGVYADNSICLDRVKSRDPTIHINISDDNVIMINEKVRERNYETDYKIVNEDIGEEKLGIELKNILELEAIIQSI